MNSSTFFDVRKSVGAAVLALALAGPVLAATAGADPASPDPFNPANCVGSANALCTLGPIESNGTGSPINLNIPASPDTSPAPDNPANPNGQPNPDDLMTMYPY